MNKLKNWLLKLDIFGFKKTKDIFNIVNTIYPFYQIAMHDNSVFVCTHAEFVMKITNMTKQIISNRDINAVLNVMNDKFSCNNIKIVKTVDNNIYFLRVK